MAGLGLSPSPSGSSRRLSELLEEQQEPFSLDLYLLEKGCSSTALDAAGGCSVASLPCWPRSRGTSPAPRPVTASRRTPAIGLLSKFLRSAAAPASTRNNKKLRPAAIGLCSVKGEKTASKMKNALPSSSLGTTVKVHTAEAEDDEEEDDDNGSSKQLSPVSVLEHRTFEKAPRQYADIAIVAAAAIVVFRELLDAACKPALRELLARESSESKDVLTETSTTTTTATAPLARPPTRNDRATRAAHLEEIFEAEWHEHDLVPLDKTGARAGLGRWDVGTELAVAVLEALTEEAVVELMGMSHHDDANADERCWLLPNC